MNTGPGPIEQHLKSERKRSRLTIRVLAAIGLLLLLTCGVLVLQTVRDPEVQELFSTIAGSLDAPGTKELRGAGCSQAAVLDLQAAVELGLRVVGDEDSIEKGGPDLLSVLCRVPAGNPDGLDCARLAAIYTEVAHPATPVLVHLFDAGAGESICEEVFDPDGRSLGAPGEWIEGAGGSPPGAAEGASRPGADPESAPSG